jgi:hypothetical protein
MKIFELILKIIFVVGVLIALVLAVRWTFRRVKVGIRRAKQGLHQFREWLSELPGKIVGELKRPAPYTKAIKTLDQTDTYVDIRATSNTEILRQDALDQLEVKIGELPKSRFYFQKKFAYRGGEWEAVPRWFSLRRRKSRPHEAKGEHDQPA